MFGLLAMLEANRIGVFLVPPFAATRTILMLLPDAPVAQPYALIAGSVCCSGDRNQFFGKGLGMAVLAMIAAFFVISLIHAYHLPAVALASIPVLLHPGHWFPLLVVLPFAAAAVGSTAAMSKWLHGRPVYPKSLRDCAGLSMVTWRMHCSF
jgi:CBS-domain-containing membrane protein